MRNKLCALLALLLVLGAICPGAAASDEPAAELSPFVPAEHPASYWSGLICSDQEPYYYTESLSVFEDGEATLKHDRVEYRLRENGGTFLLEKDLYASPFDLQPVVTLNAGEIRLTGDDRTVRIEELADPLGIFAALPTEGLVLERHPSSSPYRYQETPWLFGNAPQFQPNTEWRECERHLVGNTFTAYGTCDVASRPDGTVRGTIRAGYEADEEDCALLWSSDAGALVRPEGDGYGELLFYGGAASGCARYTLRANYDPCTLGTGKKLVLRRYIDEYDPTTVLGRNEYQLVADYTADGWVHEPLSLIWGYDYTGKPSDYGDLFIKLTKDGRMLLVGLEWTITDYGEEYYADIYVLLDGDGQLESWGGRLPVDHTLLEERPVEDVVPYGSGIQGLSEDDYALILDDGRILVTSWGHGDWVLLDSIVFDPRGN